MLRKLKNKITIFKQEIKVYQLVLKDTRTPKIAKFFLGLAITYAISPIDIIPDFIPVLGYIDDAIIVPTLIILAIRMTPAKIFEECRAKIKLSSP